MKTVAKPLNRVDIDLKEIVSKCKIWLQYYKGKEIIYKKRIKELEKEVQDLKIRKRK